MASDARAAESHDQSHRFPSLERRASRVVLLAGLTLVLAGMFLADDHRLPPGYVTAWVAAFVLVKLWLAARARRWGWPAWGALLAEALAFLSVGALVALRLRLDEDRGGLVLVLLTAVLLGAGQWIRRKAALATAGETQDGEEDGSDDAR